MAKIIDPDNLRLVALLANIGADGTSDGNVHIDTTTKKISVAVGYDGVTEQTFGDNLTTDGVTMQALYSFLKEEWKTDASLIKFPFPMVAITPEQFEFVDGWQPTDITTVDLFRDGGFAIKQTNGDSAEEYAGVITLGTLGGTDQVYFQQVLDGASANITLQGVVNQCVKVFGDGDFSAGDSHGLGLDNTSSVDNKSYFKIFVREQAKLYAQSQLTDIGVSSFTYQAYRFPLANADDLKVTNSDNEVGGSSATDITGNGTTVTVTAIAHGYTVGDLVTISTSTSFDGDYTVEAVNTVDEFTFLDANTNTAETGIVRGTVYGDMNITYLDGTNFYTTDQINYVIDEVVRDGASPARWYICTGDGTVDATDYLDLGTMGGAGTATFTPYLGEKQIGDNYYAFNIIVDADVANDLGNPTAEEIYEFVQYSLRLNTDIDNGTGTVTGKTANSLLKFVGDTLVTSEGVFIDDYKSADINRLEFYDTADVTVSSSTSTLRTFPFIAAGVINFNQNLIDDSGAIYRMFFTNDDAGDNTGADFGTATAVLVGDKDGVDIVGDIAVAQVEFSYAYDSNIQRGAASAGEPAPVTVVAIGLDKAQYVKASSTINKSNANSVSLVAALERNYTNPFGLDTFA